MLSGAASPFQWLWAHMSHDPVVWVGAIATLGIYSILYRENPVFRFFEHVFIGVATGYGVQIVWVQIIGPKWWDPMVNEGRWYWIFALLLASLFYFVYSRRLAWLNRLAIGIFMGLSAGLGLKGFVTEVMPKVAASFKPLWVPHNLAQSVNHVIFFITLFAVMSYFFFSVEHRGRTLTSSARLGRMLLMISFGCIFGLTVMGRISLLLERLRFLLFDWLRLPPA